MSKEQLKTAVNAFGVSPDAFARQHDYLICVDSDGCAVDTMDIKHKRCFGPCMVAEWGLEIGRAHV